jgi:hypothetical protein
MKRLCIALIALAALALCFAPFMAANAQATTRVTRKYIVEDSPCAPSTAWRMRDTLFGTLSSARAQSPIPCVVPPPPPPPPPPIDTIPTPPPVGAFTVCVNVVNVCTFTGKRDVRLVNAAGAVRAQFTQFGRTTCYAWGIDNDRGTLVRATVSDGVRCEIGAMYTRTITNPTPGMAGSPSVWVVPVTDTGYSTSRIASGAPSGGSANGSGAQSRIRCEIVGYRVMDPVVYPGQDGVGHLHIFAGNAGISPSSTAASLAASGNGSCIGGTAIRTGYWTPAAFNRRTGRVIPQREMNAYYKCQFWVRCEEIQPIPAGLTIISGNKNATGVQPDIVEWQCGSPAFVQQTGFIPPCNVGSEVVLNITFPQCWNGRDLDSPDHMSHMKMLVYRNVQNDTCKLQYPGTYEYMIPHITELFHYPVEAGEDTRDWALSSDMYNTGKTVNEAFGRGGASAHADWVFAAEATITQFVRGCLIPRKNCEVGWLGDGRTLY